MKNIKQVLTLVTVFAFLAVLVLTSVSAMTVNVEVNDVTGGDIAAFAGQTLPVRVSFVADSNESDVRIKAWISGESSLSVSTERFDLVEGSSYSRQMSVQVPSNIDPTEDLSLIVLVEGRNGVVGAEEVSLAGQRENYVVQVLDAAMDSKVSAGQTLAIDVVLKNRGKHFSEDTFVKASIPALGIETRGYFGDLSPVDQADPNKEDAAERRLFLKIPSDAPAGIYVVQLNAYSDDSETVLTKKVSVVSSGSDLMVVPSSASKTFAVGQKANYALTIVNSGDQVSLYQLSVDSPTGVTSELDNSVVAIPAGTSKTVNLAVTASKAGTFTVGVNVNSNGVLVKRVDLAANVEGAALGGSSGIGANTTVILTVVLAIIFVVLLVVLIVLLTRKPAKTEEFGESYY